MTTQLGTRQAQNLVRRMVTRKGLEHWMDDDDFAYEAADALGIPEQEVNDDTINHLRDLVGEAVVTVRFPNTHRYRHTR